jgi:hypothetical protein
MKISEVMAKLEEIKEIYGDLPCYSWLGLLGFWKLDSVTVHVDGSHVALFSVDKIRSNNENQ